jgi:hypothetical protein
MIEDTYWATPQSTYEQRRQHYLNFCAAQSPWGRTGFFSQIARLELRQPIDEDRIHEGINFINSREDCCDFAAGGMLRILYRYPDSPHLSHKIVQRIRESLLNFKYWLDEPAGDNRRCYWTENHQIIFHSDELLAAQLFRDQIFTNDGKDAAYHREHALRHIRRWLRWRELFGFSEWLSNCYFEEDLLALVNLFDFADDADIRVRSRQLIDFLLFEMALHTFRGVMGCSHGRTYPRLIKGGRGEGSASTAKLMFGMGLFNSAFSLGAIPLATSSYRCPPILEKIAADLDAPLLFLERHSVNVEDAPKFGVDFDNPEDLMLFWSTQDYTHPLILERMDRMMERLHISFDQHLYHRRWERLRQEQVQKFGRVVDPNVDAHVMSEVHIQTYRTPNYLLSCAQDYRPGKPGYQQHPWQATLGIDAVVFTNHPGSYNEMSRPNFWAGNAMLPRAAQHCNVLVCLHHILPEEDVPFSHAYFPRNAFDEILEQGQWIFARKGDAYLALFIQHPYRWMKDEQGVENEVRVNQPDCVWLVEMGEKAQWQDFSTFVRTVSSANIATDHLDVTYHSPTQGIISFSWEGDLVVAGQSVALHSYPRFDNPYCSWEVDTPKMTIRRGNEQLELDFGVV